MGLLRSLVSVDITLRMMKQLKKIKKVNVTSDRTQLPICGDVKKRLPKGKIAKTVRR